MIVATGVGTVLAQMYRETRNRRWAIEDRERVAAELAATLKSETQALATTLTKETVAARKAVAENTVAIQEVKVAADAAYKEANHVNLKISDLNERLIKQQSDDRI